MNADDLKYYGVNVPTYKAMQERAKYYDDDKFWDFYNELQSADIRLGAMGATW